MRGKLDESSTFEAKKRITPACAGKTRNDLGRRRACQDHPRVCGENLAVAVLTAAEKGSPPRVRGKLQQKAARAAHPGITPACAGKTLDEYHQHPDTEDHPRVCGENFRKEYPAGISSGSPPRVRGKPLSEWERLTRLRITPACAGKTEFYGITYSWNRDHPRVCGENSVKSVLNARCKGSPPRVRGKQGNL